MKGEFTAAISMLSNEKGVSPEVVLEALESALVSAYKRNFEETELNIVARIDPGTGEPRVFIEKTVVEDPTEDGEIGLDDAREIRASAELGDSVLQDVTPRSFGRIAAQTAKQHIVQKLREAERKRVYDEFEARKEEILHGLVQRIDQRTVIMELGKTEAIMPPSEQVPTERYFPGQRLRVYLVEVHESHKGPQLLVSRTHKGMIRRLFEQEVPEIFTGTVEIKAIAREPGARSKVAVYAVQEGIDPVGSCVGMRGVRIQNIVNELSGEKIDVIPWDPDPAVFVASALSPAQVQRVDISEDDKTATVIVPERQLSLAIGREGQNARLAARLTGWRIDIKSDVAIARAELEAWASGDDLPTTTEPTETEASAADGGAASAGPDVEAEAGMGAAVSTTPPAADEASSAEAEAVLEDAQPLSEERPVDADPDAAVVLDEPAMVTAAEAAPPKRSRAKKAATEVEQAGEPVAAAEAAPTKRARSKKTTAEPTETDGEDERTVEEPSGRRSKSTA
jgi:N utilization substance protein A